MSMIALRQNSEQSVAQTLNISSRLAAFLWERLFAGSKKGEEEATALLMSQRILPALRILFDDGAAGDEVEDRIQTWLSRPNGNLGQTPPIEIIDRGQGDLVAQLLEERLGGVPS